MQIELKEIDLKNRTAIKMVALKLSIESYAPSAGGNSEYILNRARIFESYLNEKEQTKEIQKDS